MLNENVIDCLLNDVQSGDTVLDVKLTLDELIALEKVAYIISKHLYEMREEIESNGGDIGIKKSLFIDSLVSASNVLNSVTW
jgi:hypothetical protein